jgi:ribosomal 50S subunit-recycling heat shock protein
MKFSTVLAKIEKFVDAFFVPAIFILALIALLAWTSWADKTFIILIEVISIAGLIVKAKAIFNFVKGLFIKPGKSVKTEDIIKVQGPIKTEDPVKVEEPVETEEPEEEPEEESEEEPEEEPEEINPKRSK